MFATEIFRYQIQISGDKTHTEHYSFVIDFLKQFFKYCEQHLSPKSKAYQVVSDNVKCSMNTSCLLSRVLYYKVCRIKIFENHWSSDNLCVIYFVLLTLKRRATIMSLAPLTCISENNKVNNDDIFPIYDKQDSC